MPGINRNNIKYRIATYEDLLNIVDLNREEYGGNVEDWNKIDTKQKWEIGSWWVDLSTLQWHWDILQMCKGCILLAIHDNKIIGELDFVFSHDIAEGQISNHYHIIWLLVDKVYRRKGIARGLIDLLKQKKSLPVWVEAENYQSDTLYRSVGKIVQHISNWEINRIDFVEKIPNKYISRIKDLKSLYNIVHNRWQLIIGRYYAPSFDVAQLCWSDPVDMLIWGNSPEVEILEYKFDNTHAIAIITQHLRLYVEKEYLEEDLIIILQHASYKTIVTGFEGVFVQIYKSDKLHRILKKVGFQQIGELDPVYNL